MIMAKAVDELAASTPGKKSIAIESFARALRQVIIKGQWFFNFLVTHHSCR